MHLLLKSDTNYAFDAYLRTAALSLVNIDCRGCGGRSLLHMAVDSSTSVNDDDIELSEMFQFPSDATVELLLLCAHDINCEDNNGDTALHVLAKQFGRTEDEKLLESIFRILIMHNAACNIKNKQGRTVIDILTDASTVTSMLLATNLSFIANTDH